jgi:cellulose synthase/poly-beta-1,6-N-acetylglucosamine synthase-like glycosyltransferase
MTGKYFVSIIIPTYNEEADIRRTLDACVRLQYPHKEVIVVDDSQDNTPNIVKEYEPQGVKLMHRAVNRGGRSGARNVGILEARGDIVIILNADVFPAPDFIDRLLPHYENGADYVMVGARVANQEKLFARFVEAQYHDNYDGQDWITWTEGFSCRRAAALKVGMFPAEAPIPLCAGEDGCFGERLMAHGYKKVIDRSIVVHHIAPDRFAGYWKARKEKCSPVTSYFLKHTPVWKLSIKACFKTGMLVAQILLIAPTLFRALKYTRFSSRGLKDLMPFSYALGVQALAFLAGEWQGLIAIVSYVTKPGRPTPANGASPSKGETRWHRFEREA